MVFVRLNSYLPQTHRTTHWPTPCPGLFNVGSPITVNLPYLVPVKSTNWELLSIDFRSA